MNQPIRCFVAIEIPETIQNKLARIQGTLRKQIQKASWVKPNNIHLTLKFLGDVDPDDIQTIGETIEGVAIRHRSFSLRVGGLGAFPNFARPRVLWAGVKVGSERVSDLAQDINVALTDCGFSIDTKKFNSHLTIARVKERIDLRPYANQYRQYDRIDGAEMSVRTISLIQSQLHPTGAIYSTLQSYSLT
ncbi:RNA 2',3'-cyclic phosphodiesterase [Candidatus Poribacteria bacterium]|nr:MAG: RNA 2',3'-cyclic phosphodiesterase [Candidatus Poribacteria bacterium]